MKTMKTVQMVALLISPTDTNNSFHGEAACLEDYSLFPTQPRSLTLRFKGATRYLSYFALFARANGPILGSRACMKISQSGNISLIPPRT